MWLLNIVPDIMWPLGGLSQIISLVILFGIHSTKYELLALSWFIAINLLSYEEIWPLNIMLDDNHLPWFGIIFVMKALSPKRDSFMSTIVGGTYFLSNWMYGPWLNWRKWSFGKLTRFTACFLRSVMFWPGYLILQVRSFITVPIRLSWSLYVGF